MNVIVASDEKPSNLGMHILDGKDVTIHWDKLTPAIIRLADDYSIEELTKIMKDGLDIGVSEIPLFIDMTMKGRDKISDILTPVLDPEHQVVDGSDAPRMSNENYKKNIQEPFISWNDAFSDWKKGCRPAFVGSGNRKLEGKRELIVADSTKNTWHKIVEEDPVVHLKGWTNNSKPVSDTKLFGTDAFLKEFGNIKVGDKVELLFRCAVYDATKKALIDRVVGNVTKIEDDGIMQINLGKMLEFSVYSHPVNAVLTSAFNDAVYVFAMGSLDKFLNAGMYEDDLVVWGRRMQLLKHMQSNPAGTQCPDTWDHVMKKDFKLVSKYFFANPKPLAPTQLNKVDASPISVDINAESHGLKYENPSKVAAYCDKESTHYTSDIDEYFSVAVSGSKGMQIAVDFVEKNIAETQSSWVARFEGSEFLSLIDECVEKLGVTSMALSERVKLYKSIYTRLVKDSSIMRVVSQKSKSLGPLKVETIVSKLKVALTVSNHLPIEESKSDLDHLFDLIDRESMSESITQLYGLFMPSTVMANMRFFAETIGKDPELLDTVSGFRNKFPSESNWVAFQNIYRNIYTQIKANSNMDRSLFDVDVTSKNAASDGSNQVIKTWEGYIPAFNIPDESHEDLIALRDANPYEKYDLDSVFVAPTTRVLKEFKRVPIASALKAGASYNYTKTTTQESYFKGVKTKVIKESSSLSEPRPRMGFVEKNKVLIDTLSKQMGIDKDMLKACRDAVYSGYRLTLHSWLKKYVNGRLEAFVPSLEKILSKDVRSAHLAEWLVHFIDTDVHESIGQILFSFSDSTRVTDIHTTNGTMTENDSKIILSQIATDKDKCKTAISYIEKGVGALTFKKWRSIMVKKWELTKFDCIHEPDKDSKMEVLYGLAHIILLDTYAASIITYST